LLNNKATPVAFFYFYIIFPYILIRNK